MPKTALLCLLLVSLTASAADNLKVLKSFGLNLNNGSDLYSGFVLDSAGALYGTAESGGAHQSGVVYKLTPSSQGAWTETVLYSFRGGKEDGSTPHATLVWDGQGNLYGTTLGGGLGANGVVYELSPGSSGEWTETVLYRFTGGADGGVPFSSLTLDADGNLYGTTTGGGKAGLGVLFELTRASGNGWTETVLHTFTGNPDGAGPFSAPIFDAEGNLYGVTYSGGVKNDGAVYQLSPSSNTSWTERVLHSFQGGEDGVNPSASLVMDQVGNLYGTTVAGGKARVGTAFELVKAADWAETQLHAFLGLSAHDGANPNGLIFDAHGNLWGTTVGGGLYNPGTIFELLPQGNGTWEESVLYSFTGGNDGAYPSSGLVMDALGRIYGTTLWGGPAGNTTGGVAFEYIP
jgi:uncharacterized repeat protein (TIGR03803 family)